MYLIRYETGILDYTGRNARTNLQFSSCAMHWRGIPKKDVQLSLYHTNSSVPLGISMQARQKIFDLLKKKRKKCLIWKQSILLLSQTKLQQKSIVLKVFLLTYYFKIKSIIREGLCSCSRVTNLQALCTWHILNTKILQAPRFYEKTVIFLQCPF